MATKNLSKHYSIKIITTGINFDNIFFVFFFRSVNYYFQKNQVNTLNIDRFYSLFLSDIINSLQRKTYRSFYSLEVDAMRIKKRRKN